LSDLFFNFAQFLAKTKKNNLENHICFSGISFSIYNHKINKTNNAECAANFSFDQLAKGKKSRP
jgi:hypothetical protein